MAYKQTNCNYAGTWVMNTEEEIQEAEKDYTHQRNGFEGAHAWNSWVAYE